MIQADGVPRPLPYLVKEIYYTLQGEGLHTGRAAVFLRFSGCNLWSGREEDRATAQCQFCDTDFRGTDGALGGRYEAAAHLAAATRSCWPATAEEPPMVVCTGGEPLLQLDEQLVKALQERGFFVAVESNGTRVAPLGIDWLCISPKEGTELVQRTGDELKLVYPQQSLDPRLFEGLHFGNFFLQPMDGDHAAENTRRAVEFCLQNPRWRLSLQTHKILRIR